MFRNGERVRLASWPVDEGGSRLLFGEGDLADLLALTTRTPIVFEVPCSFEATHLYDCSSLIKAHFMSSSALPFSKSYDILYLVSLSTISDPSSLYQRTLGTVRFRQEIG